MRSISTNVFTGLVQSLINTMLEISLMYDIDLRSFVDLMFNI